MRCVAIIFALLALAASPAALAAAPTTVPSTRPAVSSIERQPIRPTGNAAGPQTRTTESDSTPTFSVTRVLLSLVIVLGLVFALRWVAVRFLGMGAIASPSKMVRVVSRQMISPRQHVLILQVGGRVLVVGSSGSGQLSTLSEITDPDEVAAMLGTAAGEKTERARSMFGQLFESRSADYDEPDAADPRPQPDQAPDSAAASSPASETTREELAALMSRVRDVSRKFASGPTHPKQDKQPHDAKTVG